MASATEVADKTDETSERSSAEPLRIASPPDGATYMIDPTLRQDYQTVSLRAVSSRGGNRITWRVNGSVVGTASADHPLRWALRPGRHTIIARDESGRTDRSMIYVK